MLIKTLFLLIIISQLQFSQNVFWEKIKSPINSDMITFGFNSKNEVFIGTNYKGIYKSIDDGKTWENIRGKLSSGGIYSLIITEQDDLFVGVSCKTDHVTEEHPFGIYLLEYDSSEPKISFSTLYVWSMSIDSFGNIFASTDNIYDYPDVVKLQNGNSEWIGIESGLPLDMLTKIIIDKHSNLYITKYDDGGGLFLSKDIGNSWTLVENEFNNVIILDIVSDSKGNLVGEFENQGVYKSTDEGKTWSIISNKDNIKNYIRTYGIQYDKLDNLYINYFPKGIFRSRDGGESWEKIGDNSLDNSIWNFSIDRNGLLWIFTSKSELYRSTSSIFN